MLTLKFWVACFLMVSMLVWGYLCLIVKETTRDYEHGSVFYKSLYWHTCQSVANYLREIDLFAFGLLGLIQ